MFAVRKLWSDIASANDYIAAAPVVEPAGLNLDMLRPRWSVIANDRVERPKFFAVKYTSIDNGPPLASHNSIKQPEFATRPRCDARARPNQGLWCKFLESTWVNIENKVRLMQREPRSRFRAQFFH